MTNHPNRNWRSRWTVDLPTHTVTHRDGWVFQFAPAENEPGAYDGRCIAHPEMTTAVIQQAARIAREAGDVYGEAREAEREKRGRGRPRTVGGKNVNIYLDADSIERAKRLGDGSVSQGIRRALQAAADEGDENS